MKVFNVFSGHLIDFPDIDKNTLQLGFLPLKSSPKSNCKKCYGRFYIGKNSQNLTYIPCSCVNKVLDLDILKEIEKQYSDLFK